jgi:hypothetical protein
MAQQTLQSYQDTRAAYPPLSFYSNPLICSLTVDNTLRYAEFLDMDKRHNQNLGSNRRLK